MRLLPQGLQKRLQIQSYEILAGVIILLATALRVMLVARGWPGTDGDEAIMNLEALHIGNYGEHPIFFYGQHYLGVLEAYVGALILRLCGASTLPMRLEMIAFTAGFFICLFILTCKLYTRAFALLILVLFLFGSQWTMMHQILPTGYPELPLFVTLIFLLSYTLAASRQLPFHRRLLLYFLWGLLVGLGFWGDLLIAPYVLVSSVLLLVFCWREVLKRAGWLSLLGLCIGAAPLLFYNLTAAPGQDSLHVLLHLVGNDTHPSLKYHLIASIFYALPLTLGYASSACIPTHWSGILFAGPEHRSCEISMGAWGLLYLLLAGCALLLSCLALRKWYRLERSNKRHHSLVREFARLMLLCGFGLSFLSYARGGGVSLDPIDSWRYLICTWVSLPAVLWPLWTCDQSLQQRWTRGGALLLKYSVLLGLGFALISSTVSTFQQQVPLQQAKNQRLAHLENTLEYLHMTRFYSEYWTCNPILLETQEQLICSNTSNTLAHSDDRYALYPMLVEADPHPGFVYPNTAQQITTLNTYLARYHLQYERITLPGYVIYRMYGHIPSLNL